MHRKKLAQKLCKKFAAGKIFAQLLCKFFYLHAKFLRTSCASFFSCASLVGSCYFISFYFIANGRTAYMCDAGGPAKPSPVFSVRAAQSPQSAPVRQSASDRSRCRQARQLLTPQSQSHLLPAAHSALSCSPTTSC